VVIPIPDFTASVTEGVVPLEVVFTDTSTGDVAAWSWDFGDGEGATVQDPTHVFTEAGRYTVRLVVDSGYDTHEVTKSNYITVAFTDMGLDNWAADAVFACADAGIVAGYDDGLYHPEWPVTRDQMAVYISRALAGGDSNVPEFTDTPTFPDVPEDNWALDYIEYAVDQGVVTGYDDGNYHPEYEVTRDQMAVYVARALVAPTGEAALADYVPSDPRNFPDVPDTSWAYKHIEYCVENGVVQGYLDGYYHPEITVTRDQMAVYVARAFGLPM
jgi:PKD repeat protein